MSLKKTKKHGIIWDIYRHEKDGDFTFHSYVNIDNQRVPIPPRWPKCEISPAVPLAAGALAVPAAVAAPAFASCFRAGGRV